MPRRPATPATEEFSQAEPEDRAALRRDAERLSLAVRASGAGQWQRNVVVRRVPGHAGRHGPGAR